jgi:hypothetical protein
MSRIIEARMKARIILPALLAAVVFARPTLGIIVINPDESVCLAPPSDGSPWNYVARMDNKFGARASGVYIGNRYLLTANHIDHDIIVVHLNGMNCTVDESFPPMQIKGTDLRMMRIKQDPGLAPLPLIGVAESEFNKPCTMIGYGLGKGTEVPNQGWNWGEDPSRKKRWATNRTLPAYKTDPQSHITYIQTAFDIAAGPQTGQITGGDSGCGLFENLNGVWKLVGIGADVDVDNKALYDKDLAVPGNQPDHSYFVSIRQFVMQIKRIRES